MEEEKERKGEAPAPIIHALSLTPSHPSSSACLLATTARGKCCSCCRHSLIIIRNQQQGGPVVSLRQCTGFVSATHVDEAENLTPVQSSSLSQHRDRPERKERLRGRQRAVACLQRTVSPTSGASLATHMHAHRRTCSHTRTHSLLVQLLAAL